MRKTLRLLAAFAMIALISAGCSNATAGTGAGSSTGNERAATAPAQSGSSGGNNAIATGTSASSPESVSSTGTSGGNTAAAFAQGVKFAQCMRANGVSEFPDPSASGAFTIDQIANGSSLNPNSAAFTQAISACKDLEPPGFTGSTRSPEQQQAALKFAQCMRGNGATDFPDPSPNGPLVDTNRIPSAATSSGKSLLRAAMQKCSSFAAAAGVAGGQ